MRDYSQRFAVFVLRWRFVFILLSSLFTLYFLFSLRNLSIQTSLGDLTPQKHPYMEVQKQLMYIFGGLNQVSIGLVVKEGDIFNTDILDKVVRITKKLYLLDGVNPGRIVSLSARKIKNTRAYEDGFEVKRLMRNPPETPAAMKGLKESVIRNPMYYGPLVSKDLKATLLTNLPDLAKIARREKVEVNVGTDEMLRIYHQGRLVGTHAIAPPGSPPQDDPAHSRARRQLRQQPPQRRLTERAPRFEQRLPASQPSWAAVAPEVVARALAVYEEVSSCKPS